MNFDYKKYSLGKLEEWMHDALSCDDLAPQEIFDVIKNVVTESYYYHKHHASRSYEILELLNGHRPVRFDDYDGWDSFEPNEKSTLISDKDDSSEESHQYTEEEMNAMCDKAASDEEKDKCREYNLREAEYYDKRAKLDAEHHKSYDDIGRNKSYKQMVADGYEMTADGFWVLSK